MLLSREDTSPSMVQLCTATDSYIQEGLPSFMEVILNVPSFTSNGDSKRCNHMHHLLLTAMVKSMRLVNWYCHFSRPQVTPRCAAAITSLIRVGNPKTRKLGRFCTARTHSKLALEFLVQVLDQATDLLVTQTSHPKMLCGILIAAADVCAPTLEWSAEHSPQDGTALPLMCLLELYKSRPIPDESRRSSRDAAWQVSALAIVALARSGDVTDASRFAAQGMLAFEFCACPELPIDPRVGTSRLMWALHTCSIRYPSIAVRCTRAMLSILHPFQPALTVQDAGPLRVSFAHFVRGCLPLLVRGATHTDDCLPEMITLTVEKFKDTYGQHILAADPSTASVWGALGSCMLADGAMLIALESHIRAEARWQACAIGNGFLPGRLLALLLIVYTVTSMHHLEGGPVAEPLLRHLPSLLSVHRTIFKLCLKLRAPLPRGTPPASPNLRKLLEIVCESLSKMDDTQKPTSPLWLIMYASERCLQGNPLSKGPDSPVWTTWVPFRCHNPDCDNLAGPTDASLLLKECPCHATKYCSTDCQRVHWVAGGHHKVCAARLTT